MTQIIKNLSKRHFPSLGIIATLIIGIGFIVPQFQFVGSEQQAYSIYNHFISELGWIDVSKHAMLFNGCLILSGVLFALFTYGVVAKFEGFWSRITCFLGVMSSLSLSFVGIFPVQSNLLALGLHLAVASVLFTSLYLTVLSIPLMIFFDKNQVIPKAYLLVYLVVPLYFFLWVNLDYDFELSAYLDHEEVMISNRPDIWFYPVLEWSTSLLGLANVFIISIFFLMRQILNKDSFAFPNHTG